MGTTGSVLKRRGRPAERPWMAVLDLALIGTGFLLALGITSPASLEAWTLDPGPATWDLAIQLVPVTLIFWLSGELNRRRAAETGSGASLLIEQFCLGAGSGLILHTLLAYAIAIPRTPMMVIWGALLASVLVTLRVRSLPGALASRTGGGGGGGGGILAAGCDARELAAASAFAPGLVGCVGGVDPGPDGVKRLGRIEEFERVVEETGPAQILVGAGEGTRRIPPRALIECRLAGIEVIEFERLYENRLQRVCTERLKPADLILSPALRADSRIMAVQSIYTNLLGLSFLFLLAPLLLLLALLVRFTSRGPVFESVECLGFQKIPFRLWRFRIHRWDGSGRLTWAGRWIARFHLVNIPQVFNVVRGEMALFGPRPARQQFAQRLAALIPYYSHRFSVKPGILGWAQVNLRRSGETPGETLQIEYDLYYLKQGSPLMDLEILARTLLPPAKRPEPLPAGGHERAQGAA